MIFRVRVEVELTVRDQPNAKEAEFWALEAIKNADGAEEGVSIGNLEVIDSREVPPV
jgi:hypothetical protein